MEESTHHLDMQGNEMNSLWKCIPGKWPHHIGNLSTAVPGVALALMLLSANAGALEISQSFGIWNEPRFIPFDPSKPKDQAEQLIPSFQVDDTGIDKSDLLESGMIAPQAVH